DACRSCRESGDHEYGVQLAELYRPLALPGVAEERLAQASEGLARASVAKLAQAAGPQAAALQEQARANFRKAGSFFEQAARHRPAEQAALLGRAADCPLLALDHAPAATVLQEFVHLEQNPQRQVQGWFALGGAHRALRQVDESRKAYYKCIETPQSTLVYRARNELADLEQAEGNLDHAEEILRQNLTTAGTEPDRKAQEQSLYRLA